MSKIDRLTFLEFGIANEMDTELLKGFGWACLKSNFVGMSSELELKTSEIVIVMLIMSAAPKIVDIKAKYLIIDRLNFNSIAYSFLY